MNQRKVRIISVDHDSLTQLEDNDLYDPEDKNICNTYVGKIGLVQDTIKTNLMVLPLQVVEFANGYQLVVTGNDVIDSDEEVTCEEYLPVSTNNTKQGAPLTQDEKDFTDKVFLKLLDANDDTDSEELFRVAIHHAIVRTKMYAPESNWIRNEDE